MALFHKVCVSSNAGWRGRFIKEVVLEYSSFAIRKKAKLNAMHAVAHGTWNCVSGLKDLWYKP